MEFEVLKDFEFYSKVPDEIIMEYKEKFPAQFIEIWKNYGFGTFLNVFLRIINPNDYMDFTQKSYFEKKIYTIISNCTWRYNSMGR